MQNSVASSEGAGTISVNAVIKRSEEPFILVCLVEHREAMSLRISAESAKVLGRALLQEARRLGELVEAEDFE